MNEEMFMATTLEMLKDYRFLLLSEQRTIDDKIAAVEEHIVQVRSLMEGKESSPPPRKRRGDNARIVREWFDSHKGQGFTVVELMEGTGLPHSSVHGVLKREDGYTRGHDGRWWYGSPPALSPSFFDEQTEDGVQPMPAETAEP